MSVVTIRPTAAEIDLECDHPPLAWLVSSDPYGGIYAVCGLCGAVPALGDPEEVPSG